MEKCHKNPLLPFKPGRELSLAITVVVVVQQGALQTRLAMLQPKRKDEKPPG